MIKYTTTKLGERRTFIHLEIALAIFRFSFFKMRKDFCIRFEIKKGFK